MIRSENRRKRPKFEKFPVKFPVSREFDPETGSPLTGSSAMESASNRCVFVVSSLAPIEQVSPLIQRQYLHGSQSTFTKRMMTKGAVVPLHHHANEQITWITQGEAEVYSQGKKYVMHAGDIMIIPPNVPHEFWFTQDTIDIDSFSPQRQDWMDGTADYFSKK